MTLKSDGADILADNEIGSQTEPEVENSPMNSAGLPVSHQRQQHLSHIPSLDDLFYYQDAATGGASSTCLTLRQLVRLVGSGGTQKIHGGTNVLPVSFHSTDPVVDKVGGTNGGAQRENERPAPLSSVWKRVDEIAVLREAASSWYFEEQVSTVESKIGKAETISRVVGPVSCRDLAMRYYRADDKESLTLQTRIYQSPSSTNGNGTASGQWSSLGDLPSLLVSLSAWEDSVPSLQRPSQLLKPEVVSKFTKSNQKQNFPQDSSQTIQDEFESFLKSTDDDLGRNEKKKRTHPDRAEGEGEGDTDDDASNEESYESDGGTRYVKHPKTGNWVHEDLMPPTSSEAKYRKDTATPSNEDNSLTAEQRATNGKIFSMEPKKKKQKKAQFASRKARNWIYIQGLPVDATVDEVASTFSRAGIIDLDPESQRPKVKVYTDPVTGLGKGDASVCYARPESVELALVVLDGAAFRPLKNPTKNLMQVERAKFEAKAGQDSSVNRPRRFAEAQRKVARLAAKQAMDWTEAGEGDRLAGGRKGLCIIVIKHLFYPKNSWRSEEEENDFFGNLEHKLRTGLEEFGPVEKITVFSKHPEGVAVVKFSQPTAASNAISSFHGRLWENQKLEAIYWDGVADYTVRDEASEKMESKKREEEFGNWLDSHELPEELRLKTE